MKSTVYAIATHGDIHSVDSVNGNTVITTCGIVTEVGKKQTYSSIEDVDCLFCITKILEEFQDKLLRDE